MKIRTGIAVVERASSLGEFPEVELPDGAVVTDISRGTYILMVTYYVVTLGPGGRL